MATTEEVIGRTEDGRIIVYWENAGPASYDKSGNMSVSIGTLRAIKRIVRVGNNGGYRTESEEAVISGNGFTIPVRYYYYACPYQICTIGYEVPDGQDLSGITFSGIVIGH